MLIRSMLLSGMCLLLAGSAFAQADPKADPQAPDTYQVKLETSSGPVVIDVKRELAPKGADRFYRLVKEGFYDDVRVFRMLDGFVAQFGMSGDPQTNAKWSEARIGDDPVKVPNKRGTIVFATSGPNSRTTQLFINLADNSRSLDRMGFSPFGTVDEASMKTVGKFYAGYGEGAPNGNGPDQGRIRAGGNQYLDSRFPMLTKINTARVVAENGKPVEEPAQ